MKPESIKVILVEPCYEENIGYVARAMKNFGLSELTLVNQKCKHYTTKARSRAMHAQSILLNAKKFSSLKSALKGTDIAIAVTARTKQNKIFRSALTVKQFAKQFSKSEKKIALVFGKESDGLTNEEVQKCDFCVTIPSSREYRSLNLSHAAAIVFYEIFPTGKKPAHKTKAKKNSGKLKKGILKNYAQILPQLELKDNKNTLQAFKAFLTKSPLNEAELKNLLNVFVRVRKKLEQKAKP